LRSAVVSLALAAASGCAAGPAGDVPWGSEAVRYFEALSVTLDDDDVYGVLDFYAPGATVQDRTSDFQDTPVPVAEYLVSHRADLGRRLLGVHLGTSDAVVLVEWHRSGRHGAIATTMDATGAITRETVFVDVDSLGRSLLASPEVAAHYTDLYRDYGLLWSSGRAAAVRELYAPDAIVAGALGGREARGHDEIGEAASETTRMERVGAVPRGAGDAATAPALYLDPVSFGDDPQRAIGVFETGSGDCDHRVAVLWRLDDSGRIAEETRYPEVESFRGCGRAASTTGWWSDRDLPGPRDEIVTGTITTPEGRRIAVHNGTDRLEALVEWGLDRFAAAELEAPRLDSVTFEPTRRCEGVGGRLVAGETAHDLVLCIRDRDLCARGRACPVPNLAIRAAMLHEMGHAWLHDQAGDATRRSLLTVSGRRVWSDPDVLWVERGVEYAAEVIAWGLIDEPIRLEQLGNPPCEELTAAFDVLTGRRPILGDAACSG
jgi:hypothetical protein